MRDLYHDELDDIGRRVLEMINLVAVAVQRATEALLDANLALADRVIAGDDRIDALRVELEDRRRRRAALAGRWSRRSAALGARVEAVHEVQDVDVVARIDRDACRRAEDPAVRQGLGPHRVDLEPWCLLRALRVGANGASDERDRRDDTASDH